MNRLIETYVMPPAVFVSVVVGGGYATGREIVQFFSQYGVLGGLSAAGLSCAIFAIVLGCTY